MLLTSPFSLCQVLYELLTGHCAQNIKTSTGEETDLVSLITPAPPLPYLINDARDFRSRILMSVKMWKS